MKQFWIVLLAGILSFASIPGLYAQQSLIYQDPGATYRSALDLYNKEKYVDARELFLDISGSITDPGSLLRANAEYYAAMCGVELFNNNAEYALSEFINDFPENSRSLFANFALGKLEYRKSSFSRAIQYFERVNPYDLDRAGKDEYYFKLGYSQLRINDPDKAEKTLANIKNPNSTYAGPALYYIAHIAYVKKNYDKALACFKKLRDDATFQSITPYYICQIYYQQKDYDNLLNLAPGLLEKASVKRAPEIARMVAEAYYQTKRYKEALPYFHTYTEKIKGQISAGDHYAYAYSAYQTGDIDKAVEQFNLAVENPDSLAQNAFYHLGDCYLKKGQKKFALNSFYSAYKESFDPEIREDALFNYAKLSYELGYNPYNEAIKALKQYIKEFPQSKRTAEAYTYLVDLYMSTHNYKDALASLDSIPNKDEKLMAAYQRLAFYRGVEFFNESDYKEATGLFDKSMATDDDKEIMASSYYWSAECKYRLNNFPGAISGFRQFLVTPGAFSLNFYYLANYNLGYCYFKLKEYNNALAEYRKFLENKDKSPGKFVNDACLREGDCYFILKSYEEAVVAYSRAIELKVHESDYALYQKALAYGALGKYAEKAATLEELISAFPKSNLAEEAKYECGITYLNLHEDEKARIALQKLVDEHPNNNLVKNALLRIGLIQYNKNNNEAALMTFKKVVSDFPGTAESKEALISIRNIYVDMNKVDDFFLFAKSLPFANVSNAEQDSISYLASENQYMSGDCNSSSIGFKNYNEKFPQGIFRTNAHFYLAECMLKQNQADDALTNYLFVINAPKNKFMETALVNAAAIYYSRKEYQKALDMYKILEGNEEYSESLLTTCTGLMRCNFLLDKFDDAISSSRKLLDNEKISSELSVEAHMTIALSAFKAGNIPLAQTEFEKTYKMNKGEKGAESKYHLALIQYNQENYKDAEKIIFEFINEFSSYDFWLAKSFILLADVYVKMGNTVQAKQTLQSIIDNYDGPDLVETAHKKMDSILEAEKEDAAKKAEEAKKAREDELNIGPQNLLDNK